MAFYTQKLTKKATLSVVRPSNRPVPQLAPAAVYILADNLDAALAAGEDLVNSVIVWNAATGATDDDIAAAREAQRIDTSTVRSLEMILVARVLKSRERAEELGRRDVRFRDLAKLYTAGTALLIEATAEFGDATVHDFDTGDAPIAYWRRRGLICNESAAPLEDTTLTLNDSFLIAGRISLGVLLDLIAMFLDTLEIHYELFQSEPGETDEEIDGF